MIIGRTILTTIFMLAVLGLRAQELQVKVNINHSQISGTDISVFENLQQTIEHFINERQWTPLQFQKQERIQCSLNITVLRYNRDDNHFECTALIQANRPVYNSSYTTTLYNNKDDNFHFVFSQFDQLNFNDENVDQPLTATGIVTYMGLDIHNLPSLRLSDDVNGLVYVHPCLRSEAEYEGIQVGDTVTVTGSFHILSNDWGVVLKNSTVTK